MVELFENELNMPNRQSSKGNQLKFKRDNVWYKADYLGYEGLAEYTVSKLLRCSSLKAGEYVDYDLDQISCNGQLFNACRSNDFTEGWQLITLERLFRNMYGESLNSMIYSVRDHTERLKLLVNQIERVTGISGFGEYMCKILTVDALFLNEDRHTHNLAVLTDGSGNYRLCPIFDNGAGLLSNMQFYRSDIEPKALIKIPDASPFHMTFNREIKTMRDLYGSVLKIPKFNSSELSEMLSPLLEYYPKRDRGIIADRVITTIIERAKQIQI